MFSPTSIRSQTVTVLRVFSRPRTETSGHTEEVLRRPVSRNHRASPQERRSGLHWASYLVLPLLQCLHGSSADGLWLVAERKQTMVDKASSAKLSNIYPTLLDHLLCNSYPSIFPCTIPLLLSLYCQRLFANDFILTAPLLVCWMSSIRLNS